MLSPRCSIGAIWLGARVPSRPALISLLDVLPTSVVRPIEPAETIAAEVSALPFLGKYAGSPWR